MDTPLPLIPVDTTARLRWGPSWIKAPEGVTALWGARAITSSAGFDLLGDRQDMVGETQARLLTRLNDALPDVRRAARCAFDQGLLAGNTDAVVTFYAQDGLVVVGTCQRSHGYLYLLAWEGEPPPAGVYGPTAIVPLAPSEAPSESISRLLNEAAWGAGMWVGTGMKPTGLATALKRGWVTQEGDYIRITALGRRALATRRPPAPTKPKRKPATPPTGRSGWSLWGR